MKINKNVAVSDSGFVFNPTTGDSFSVNPIGGRIIELLKQNYTTEKIVNILQTEFDVNESTAEKDVQDFVETLKSYYIIENQ